MVNTPCIIWDKRLTRDGYGCVGGGNKGAHVIAYESVHGPVPNGLQIDHLCRVRACVNPDHLEAVTSRENTMRGFSFAAINAKKTHCNNGHPFDNVNTYFYNNKYRQRTCRICNAAAVARYKNKGAI